MISSSPIVISSGSPPPGTSYAERAIFADRSLLNANHFSDRVGLVRAAESEHAALRGAAYHLLAEEATPQDEALLQRGLSDREGVVRAWAAFGLERLQRGAGISALHELARQAPAFAEYGPLVAASALARLGDPVGLETIRKALLDLDEPVAVVQHLYWFAALGRPEIWTLYEQALADPTPPVRELALLQLRQLSDPAALAVVQRFAAAHPEESAAASLARDILAERAQS